MFWSNILPPIFMAEILVPNYWTKLCHYPEDHIINLQHCKNLIPSIGTNTFSVIHLFICNEVTQHVAFKFFFLVQATKCKSIYHVCIHTTLSSYLLIFSSLPQKPCMYWGIYCVIYFEEATRQLQPNSSFHNLSIYAELTSHVRVNMVINSRFQTYNLIRGSSYLCWLVRGSALHIDRCTAGSKVHTNFNNESACLMTNNVCKLLTLRTFDGIMFHSEQCGSYVGIYDLSAVGGSYQLH